MDNQKKFLWTEKYRPQTFDDVIFPHPSIADFFKSITHQIPNMILHGPPGTGKSTAGFILGKQIGADTLIINGSLERNIDTLRTTIQEFASTVTLSADSPHKLVIIEEADYTNQQSFQPALRRVMEEYADNCRFIFTCNYVKKLIEPLRSRSVEIDFRVPPNVKSQYLVKTHQHLCQVLQNENIPHDPEVVAKHIFNCYPDIRKTLGLLQSIANSQGTVNADEQVSQDANFEDLVKLLTNTYMNTTQKFSDIRKWVNNNPVEAAHFFTDLYKKMTEMNCPDEKIPSIILIIAEYQYKANFVADQEINTVAALLEISVLFDD